MEHLFEHPWYSPGQSYEERQVHFRSEGDQARDVAISDESGTQEEKNDDVSRLDRTNWWSFYRQYSPPRIRYRPSVEVRKPTFAVCELIEANESGLGGQILLA